MNINALSIILLCIRHDRPNESRTLYYIQDVTCGRRRHDIPDPATGRKPV